MGSIGYGGGMEMGMLLLCGGGFSVVFQAVWKFGLIK